MSEIDLIDERTQHSQIHCADLSIVFAYVNIIDTISIPPRYDAPTQIATAEHLFMCSPTDKQK